MFSGDHPFATPLADLTAEELDQKHTLLMGRWYAARRMNMDQGVMHQLDLLLNSIEAEKDRRRGVDDLRQGVILDTDPIISTTFNPKRS